MQVSGHVSCGFCLSSCETFLFLLLLSLLFWGHFEDMKYLSSLLSLELVQKRRWTEVFEARERGVFWGEFIFHPPAYCCLRSSTMAIIVWNTYKHRHALPQMGEHSRPLSRENIWALWLFFYSVHWWKRVIMYSLQRRLSSSDWLCCHSNASTGKIPFVFKPLEPIPICMAAICVLFSFFFVNQHSPSQPFTVIMCSHTKSQAKTPNYFP